MRSITSSVAIVLLIVLAAGCGDGTKKDENAYDIAAAFAEVSAARADLTTTRQELDNIQTELQVLTEKSRLTDAEQARKTELENQLKQKQQAFDEAFAADQAALSEFLNTTLNDEELRQAEQTRQALQLYAEEAVRNAEEFIAESGDYRRAIELLENASQYFEFAGAPIPEGLQGTLETARAMRYLTKDRFDQVKTGMTEAEVKAITGTPYYLNVREQERQGRKVVTWLFNREDGGVAAIHFVKGKVYAAAWDVKQG